MITKVTHGWRPGGLVAYLMGPGTVEEHVRPRVIASWDGLDEGWQPDTGPGGALDFQLGRLIGALQVPATRAGLPVSGQAPPGRGYVWHCSARLSATDRTLSDEEWAGVARRLLDGAGIATTEDLGGPRWIAVRHADDHIHVAAVLVREDTGRRFWPHHDYRGLRCTARELESELGLTPTALADRTAARRPQRAELELAARQGVEPARTELARVVREAAVAATDPGGFVDLLRGRGYLVELRRLPSGDPIGYKIARRATTPIWFGGGKLAPDLSMPKLITRWGQRGDATERLDAGVLAETRQTLERAERILRGARQGIAAENPDGIAHAVGDVVAALGARYGGALGEAASCYDGAARAPYEPVPDVGSVGSELRTLAGYLLRPRRRHRDDLDALSTVALLVALAALVQQIAQWRAEQGKRHQATAARDAQRLIRCTAEERRPRRGPPRPRYAREVAVDHSRRENAVAAIT
ncbi:relaxase/mobilization nuclease domain-containing protein [Pseudonocardia sp. GCM10023141]|uniref:relaxase/mobilization nuclease domain-containing protein n=1 Tax=Pseudonocardia sp. GCM10023141 TaxID=3252653 RepID=UPI003611E659